MIKVYVIAPDKASGYAFCDVMKLRGINAEFNYHVIRPRVIGNKITTSRDVVDDMNAIFKSFPDKTKSVVIACNTLQLWLDDIDEVHKQNIKVYTTFEACDWKFRKSKVKPLWIGTRPLVERTTSFPTFLTYKKPEIQDLVQELVWRIKMLYGDEIGTATENVKRDKDNIPLQKLKIKVIKEEIVRNIKELNIKNVILGCTELPLIFTKSQEFGINFIDPANPLADYIKSQSVTMIFAGGTISSLANKAGTHVGGKVFNLLEKLSEHMPGAYKDLNVTSSEIVYSGLSENMTFTDHKNILTEVKKTLDHGVSRIVITHGTDAMEQTARFLDKNLRDRLERDDVLIVLTGSNDHAGHAKTDAWANLRLAINEGKKFNEGGVFIAFHNRFVKAAEATKEFYTGGSMHFVSKFSAEYKRSLEKFNKQALTLTRHLDKKCGNRNEAESVMQYDVNVIRSDHRALLKSIKANKPKVVVFKLYHSGTANTKDPDSSVSTLVTKLTKEGITCFGATENGEPTDLHLYESSEDLLLAGMVPLHNMYLPVALHKLKQLRINENKLSRKEIIDRMLDNLVGEIDEKLIRVDDIQKLTKL